jgi:hypothetical protein
LAHIGKLAGYKHPFFAKEQIKNVTGRVGPSVQR